MDENQATQYLSVLELLRKSSMLVRNFRDVSPFKSMKDKRLEENISFLKWLETWEQQSQLNPTENTTFCATTLFDIKSMIIGFQQLCKVIFKKYPGASIQGNKINTDVVENTFSQVRARNGQNDNPRLIEYGMFLISTLVWICLDRAQLRTYGLLATLEPGKINHKFPHSVEYHPDDKVIDYT